MQAKLENLRSVAHSLVVAMEAGYMEINTARELERQAAMLCQEFHTWVFNYSDVIEILAAVEKWMIDGAASSNEDAELLNTVQAALEKAGMRDG